MAAYFLDSSALVKRYVQEIGASLYQDNVSSNGTPIYVEFGANKVASIDPQTMVILSAADGKILETLPIGGGTDR